jgi:hypothetical protein
MKQLLRGLTPFLKYRLMPVWHTMVSSVTAVKSRVSMMRYSLTDCSIPSLMMNGVPHAVSVSPAVRHRRSAIVLLHSKSQIAQIIDKAQAI